MQKIYLSREELASILGYKPTTLAKTPEKFPKFIKLGSAKNSKALYLIEDVLKWAKEKNLNKVIEIVNKFVEH